MELCLVSHSFHLRMDDLSVNITVLSWTATAFTVLWNYPFECSCAERKAGKTKRTGQVYSQHLSCNYIRIHNQPELKVCWTLPCLSYQTFLLAVDAAAFYHLDILIVILCHRRFLVISFVKWAWQSIFHFKSCSKWLFLSRVIWTSLFLWLKWLDLFFSSSFCLCFLVEGYSRPR